MKRCHPEAKTSPCVEATGSHRSRPAVGLLLAVGWLLLPAAPAIAQPVQAPNLDPAVPRQVDSDPEARADFDAADVVARVAGRSLTLGELMLRFASLPAEVRQRYGDRLDVFLDDLVANLVVADEAENLGLSEDPLFATLMQLQREQVLRDLYARRTVLSHLDGPMVARRYGEQVEDRFRRAPQVHLRHILVTATAEARPFHAASEDAVGEEAAEEKIARLRRRLVAAEVPFEALAKEASEDASAPQGGDLGWLTPSQLDPTLAKVAMQLPIGELSQVVESQLGWHVIEVLARRPGGTIPLSVVHELLFQELVGEQAPFLQRQAEEERRRLVQEAEVETFPERLPW